MSAEDDQPSDEMRGRVSGSRTRLWLLLEADRWVVTAIPLVAVFVSLVVLGALDPVPLQQAVANSDPIETLFQAFVAAIITGVTLVVTINQVVLSQELGAVGDQRKRMEGSMQFRKDVEGVLDVPISPPEPSAFLSALLEAVTARGEALESTLPEDADDEFRERATGFVDSLTEQGDRVTDRLEGAQFGTFSVLFAALDYNYSWKIYEARRLRAEYTDTFDEDVDAAFEDLIDVLELFGPTREHVKTLYFQWELIDLSRAMLYVSVPALIVTAATILYLDDPGSITGSTLGVHNLVWTVSAASTVALVPFMLLLSYVLRIATVAKRTLAIGPFILRESERDETGDWDDE